jgi:intracellular sulfur oxidation DsrE/DsrF family protein
MRQKPVLILVVIATLGLGIGAVHADEKVEARAGAQPPSSPDDARALHGVEQGRVVFDINLSKPSKLPLYLMVIDETLSDLERQGVTPDAILAFRGEAVTLISTDHERIELTDLEHVEKAATQIAELQKRGVRMEACSVATRLFGVDHGTLLPGIEPVGNTFVSLIGYQAQGYATIPIY